MKTSIKKTILALLLIPAPVLMFAQDKVSKVEFEGEKNIILTATSANPSSKGTLASGEEIKVECAQGKCNLVIDYKGRTIEALIGDRVTVCEVTEYDFGGDQDLELVVVNDLKGTAVLYVFAYARGIIQKLYEREVFNNRTVIKQNYIEVYSPGGLDTVLNYHRGLFWVMKPVEF